MYAAMRRTVMQKSQYCGGPFTPAGDIKFRSNMHRGDNLLRGAIPSWQSHFTLAIELYHNPNLEVYCIGECDPALPAGIWFGLTGTTRKDYRVVPLSQTTSSPSPFLGDIAKMEARRALVIVSASTLSLNDVLGSHLSFGNECKAAMGSIKDDDGCEALCSMAGELNNEPTAHKLLSVLLLQSQPQPLPLDPIWLFPSASPFTLWLSPCRMKPRILQSFMHTSTDWAPMGWSSSYRVLCEEVTQAYKALYHGALEQLWAVTEENPPTLTTLE